MLVLSCAVKFHHGLVARVAAVGRKLTAHSRPGAVRLWLARARCLALPLCSRIHTHKVDIDPLSLSRTGAVVHCGREGHNTMWIRSRNVIAFNRWTTTELMHTIYPSPTQPNQRANLITARDTHSSSTFPPRRESHQMEPSISGIDWIPSA